MEKYDIPLEKTEEERQAASQDWETTFNSIKDAVFIIDADHRIIRANQSFAVLVEVKLDDIVGQRCHELVHGLGCPVDGCPHCRTMSTGLPATTEMFETQLNAFVEVSTTPIFDGEGNCISSVHIMRDISERKHAEKTLRESEGRLNSLYNNMTEGVALHEIVFNADGQAVNYRIVDVNPQYEKILKTSRGALLGQLATEAYGTAEAPYLKEYTAVASSGQSLHFEAYFAPMDRHFHISVTPWGHGGFATLFSDISERKKQDILIKKNEVRLESLLRISQSHSRNKQDLLDYALKETIALTGSKIGYIYFYDENKQEFSLNTWSNNVMSECSVLEPQTVYHLDKTGIWGEAVRQRKAIVINDFLASNPLKKGFPEGHVILNRFLTVPIFDGSNIVAVVGVANKTDAYDDADALQLTMMMDTVWKIVTRKEAEEALSNSRSNMAAIAEASADGIIGLDLNGKITSWNKAAERIYGDSHKTTLGSNMAFYCPPGAAVRVTTALDEIKTSGQIVAVQYQWQNNMGAFRDINLSIAPIKGAAETVTGFSVLASDITESNQTRERMKSALAEKEVLMKEIHHRVKNNMQVISSLINMQNQSVTDPSTRQMLRESQDRIRSMSLVYNKLYQSGDISHISMGDYIRELVTNLIKGYTLNAGVLRSNYDIGDFCFDVDMAIPCALVINELVTNVLKYAFPDGRRGTLLISLKATDDRYILTVKDDGIGLAPGFDPFNRPSMGMKLVKTIVENQLSGSISVKGDNGTEFQVTFRKDPSHDKE